MKNFSNLVLWIILLQLPAMAALGQAATIKGQVTRADNGKPVAGADVFIRGSATSASTNAEGWYELSNLPAGKYALAVFSLGLQSQTKELQLAAGQQIVLNFSLLELETLLDELTITDITQRGTGITRLKSVEGNAIYEAKKNEVIIMADITANLATNNSRQIYSKVPGLNIWESDGAGLQLGIGGRGLSPNRTANFNTRQNGYDISADPLGYPESYYTPPAEAIKKIQLVRGAASLQYGPQFGGMLNFVMKQGPRDSPLELNSRQTIGSFGLLNSYNSLGGTTGKLNYYASYQRKQGNGWRPNSGFELNNFFVDLNFQLSKKFHLCFEYTHMNYMAQQPGGLTDAQFQQDPRQSNRARNWFNVNWNLGAVIMEYKFTDRTKLEMKNFGLLAGRDALGELGFINRADPMTERLLISDKFENLGSETRLMHHYTLRGQPAVFLSGMRYYRGHTNKLQGFGNKQSGPDFHFLNADSLYSNHRFPSQNLAFFAENIFPLSEKLTITPGIRYEWISTLSDGYVQRTYTTKNEAGLPVEARFTELDQMERSRPVWLAGIGLSYKARHNTEFYANISQNYRAINFTDLRVMNPNMYVDPNLQDESGYSADMGWRGQNKWLNYDMSLFYLKYNDKISLVSENHNGVFTRARRNISDAHIGGVESFVEGDLMPLLQDKPRFRLAMFVNLALIEGRYFDSEETAYHLKKVELVPPVNFKTGLNFRKNNFAASWQWSYVSQQYTDATNTSEIVSSAVIGSIPAYQVMDLSLQYQFKAISLEGGINNLTNQRYFTRRAEGYPGPGIIPSDARNFYLTVGYKFSKK